MSTVHQYLYSFNNHWNNRSGFTLVDLISLRSSHVGNRNLCMEYPEKVVSSVIDDPFCDIVCSHLRCLWSMWRGNWSLAFSEQTAVVQGLMRILQSGKEDNWFLPCLVTAAGDLRLVASRLDKEPQQQSSSTESMFAKPREPLEKAGETLMACFRVISSESRGTVLDSKKWGMLALINQLFKLYFRISKLHLMKPLIRAIDLSPLKDKFPLSQLITFKYYVGRKAMYDSQYSLANDYLSFAFEHCHKMSKKNKRLILIYLVPVKILLGYLPSRIILEKYKLMELWEVREAVRKGSPRALTKAIEENQEFFIKSGIYLILERLRFITYRNLFKKVYQFEGTPVVPLEDLLAALHLMDSVDMELEEATCILTNLIFQGKIKGYISHSHQKVVLSKIDAFPKLTSSVAS